jgi:hypothetical protein
MPNVNAICWCVSRQRPQPKQDKNNEQPAHRTHTFTQTHTYASTPTRQLLRRTSARGLSQQLRQSRAQCEVHQPGASTRCRSAFESVLHRMRAGRPKRPIKIERQPAGKRSCSPLMQPSKRVGGRLRYASMNTWTMHKRPTTCPHHGRHILASRSSLLTVTDHPMVCLREARIFFCSSWMTSGVFLIARLPSAAAKNSAWTFTETTRVPA